MNVCWSSMAGEEADVNIVTSGGLSLPAHSSVLGLVSSVFKKIILDRPQTTTTTSKKNIVIIPILGVPCDAVAVFLRFLYSNTTNRCIEEEEMDRYGFHLLALSHVFSVSKLKQSCTRELARRLMMDNVVDVLQLARLCDAPDLYLKSMKMLSNNFKDVQKTEGWMFLQDHDPWLELEILQFLDEAESRKKRRSKNREERCLYMQLSEAMECLEHICTDGCTSVGPYDMEPSQHKSPCEKFSTCRGLQMLIRHFATCMKRVNGGCCRCKRMWQILRLHSAICDQMDLCKVPLCRQFKLKMKLERKEEDGRWRLLARRVVSAKAMASLSSPTPKRKRVDESRNGKKWVLLR